MPKQGPCGHCGTHSTPLWRNGPKEMPILCNACGSRWRIRATLQDYLPHQHSHSSSSSFPRKHRPGRFISDSFTSRRIVTRNVSKKRRFDMSLLENGILESSSPDPWYCYCYSTDDDDNDDYEGIQCNGKCKIPSGRGKSRSSKPENVNNVDHHRSSRARTQEHGTMDKLERDLQNILQTQKGPSIDSHEDVLLYNVNSHFCSENEIGLGGVLLHPSGK